MDVVATQPMVPVRWRDWPQRAVVASQMQAVTLTQPVAVAVRASSVAVAVVALQTRTANLVVVVVVAQAILYLEQQASRILPVVA